jgi:5-formyltetrahydrofolate cyclo-ligase
MALPFFLLLQRTGNKMDKTAIRKLYTEKRRALTIPEQTKLDDLLLIQFQLVGLPFIQTLLSYWPVEKNKEPNTHLFAGYIEFKNPGLVTAYPKTDFTNNTMLALSPDGDDEFELTSFGLYEPSEGNIIAAADIDMVFVPLLAFDEKGYRLGYGKGFYDRYLPGCSKDCLKIGFSYFEPFAEIPGKHEFDVPLDLCITPQKAYVF